MIVVKLIGGLGNQMFQYALGRSLAIKNDAPLRLDVSWFGEIENKDTKRHYELGCYPIVAKTIDAHNLNIAESKITNSSSALRRLFTKPQLAVFNEPDPSFHKEVLKLPDNIYLVGYWQNQKYFSEIRQILLSEFTPKKLSNYSQSIGKKIESRSSVSVHIRRGDYATNPSTNKFHGLTPIAYYTKAIELVEQKAGAQQIFIFSDDIKWCRDNLPFAKSAIYVDGNPVGRGCEDIYLMRLCDHNIIANSSFSWWGSWLNENANKIVVAPKDWFQDRVANHKMQIVPNTWIKI